MALVIRKSGKVIKTMGNNNTDATIGCGCIVGVIAMGAAWLTHIIYCIVLGKWGFLIAGALLFPIAIVHGVMIWFGAGQ